MPNYVRLRYACEKSSTLSERLIDKFLVPLCTDETRLDRKFNAEIKQKYQHIADVMPKGWVQGITEQYLTFALFRRGGLAHDYAAHPKLLKRTTKEQEYFRFQLDHPWRFVFVRVIETLEDSFFRMEDVLTGEEFLLYSPGITMYEESAPMSMYFALLGYNGMCWQTYGPIAYFKGIQPFDLLFFAKQIDPSTTELSAVSEMIEKDPLPFMSFSVGGELPVTAHKSDMLVLIQSEFPLNKLNVNQWRESFIIHQQQDVYELKLKRWQGHPHFCCCFYSKTDRRLIVTCLTERGYGKLMESLKILGLEFPTEPQFRVTFAGLKTSGDVLSREIVLNPYEKLFEVKTSLENEAQLAPMNRYLELLIPAINGGLDYDIRELARKAEIEYETAIQITSKVLEMTNKMDKSRRK